MKTKCPFCSGIDWEDIADRGKVLMLSSHNPDEIKKDKDGWYVVLNNRNAFSKPCIYSIPVYALKCKSCGFLALFSTFP